MFISISIFGSYSQTIGNMYFTSQKSYYSSPNDAITAFFEGFRDQDFLKVLGTLDILNSAKQFDFKKYANRLEAVTWNSLMPSAGKLLANVNTMIRIGQISTQIRSFIYSILIRNENTDFSNPVIISGEGADLGFLNDFSVSVDENRLSTIEIIMIADPAPSDILNSPRLITNWKNYASMYGADLYIEKMVLFRINGRVMEEGFGLFKYSDGWKIFQLGSNISGLEIGIAKEISQTDFEMSFPK